MKAKILNAILVLTSLIGYLEWGTDQSMFLFQGEVELIQKFIEDPMSALHPFTVLPLVGQALLLITLFQKEPSRWMTLLGLAGLALLFLMILLIGIIGPNIKMFGSALPFLVTGVLTIRHHRKLVQEAREQQEA